MCMYLDLIISTYCMQHFPQRIMVERKLMVFLFLSSLINLSHHDLLLSFAFWEPKHYALNCKIFVFFYLPFTIRKNDIYFLIVVYIYFIQYLEMIDRFWFCPSSLVCNVEWVGGEVTYINMMLITLNVQSSQLIKERFHYCRRKHTIIESCM